MSKAFIVFLAASAIGWILIFAALIHEAYKWAKEKRAQAQKGQA